MRRILLITLFYLMVFVLCGTSLQISRQNTSELNIHFNLPDFNTEKVIEDGKQLNKLKVSASTDENWNENLSGLPQIEKWVYIPDGYDAQVTLVNHDISNNNDIDCYYLEDSADNLSWLDVSQPMIFRGNRILSFCIKPFQYQKDTKQLTTLNQADIRIEFTANNNANNATRLATPTSISLLNSLCINNDDIRTVTNKPGSYVVVYNGAAMLSILQPFIDWKLEKGFEVRTLDISTIGINTTALKNYLQNAYDTWVNPPEFIMIFGKGISAANYVPTWTEYYEYNTVGDYKYTLLDGNDIMPDAFIGRITFASNDELQTAINRTINYEKMQNLATSNWPNKSFLLADISDSGISCMTTISYIKNLIQEYNSTTQFIEAYSGSFPTQINTAINSGVGTYWYRGHGDFSGWTTTNINSLLNTGRFPFFSYITCFTGNFGSSSTSQAERLIRLGTPNAPKGMIGVVSASCETHTSLNNIVTGGIAFGLYKEGLTNCGPAMLRGKLSLIANYPQNPANYINQYMQSINLIGDPSVDIWLKQVTDIIVTAPTELSATGGSIAVRVTLTDNSPLENAWICLRKDTGELSVSGFTDNNGWIVLNYGTSTPGTAKLTVTKANHRTYQTSLDITGNITPISMQSIGALLHCYSGSGIVFPVTIVNNGISDLTNLTGVLESMNENTEVIQSNVTFGDVVSGVPTTSQSSFEIYIDSETPKGKVLNFNMHLAYSGGSFDIPFYCTENGPDFQILTTAFPNNLLNHGTNTLGITLQNNSSAPITVLHVLLESSHPLLTIQNPIQIVDIVNGNEQFSLTDSFNLTVSDSLPEGVNIRFNLQLYNAGGFVQSIAFDKRVGTPSINDVTGPDNYGYVCYGPADSGYVPYNWIEIDPTLGGNGTIINITDTATEGSGSFSTINIPFQMRFYGKGYSQLTVCSNGFIMPGTQGSIEWMNWQIPGPMVPRPIIAPFWDDLLTDYSSRILYKYDSDLNAEIIQWQNLKNKFSTSLRETFQVIIYDPVFHANPTGDSPILFQYKVFNNVDSGNYGVSHIDHGQYATVGIGDHTGQDGIGYTYNNQYPGTAQSISNLSTLYFTTLPTYQSVPNLIILDYDATEIIGNGNIHIDAGEQYSLSFLIKNIGLGAVTESQAVLTSSDPYITILQNQATLPNIYTNETGDTDPPFVIQIAQNCPNQHNVQFDLHIQNALDQYDLPFELYINALQLDYTNDSFTDNNNNFPEPGETGQIHFTIQNLSLINAQDLTVTVNHPASVTVTPASQVINISALTSQEVSFQITLSNDIDQGSVIDLGINLSVFGVYDSTMTLPILVGSPDVFLSTNFDGQDLSNNFQIIYNVAVQPAQYIHDTGGELSFIPSAINPWSYAFCYPLNTNDLLTTRVDFNWFSSNTNATFSLMVMLPDQSSLIALWTSTEITPVPKHQSIMLNHLADYGGFITLVFVVNTTGTDFSPIVMDDVSIITLHHAPGFISGHIDLDLYPERVTEVNLRVRYINDVYHPDDEGNYLIPVYQGISVITADLDGYVNTLDSLAVQVVSGQTNTGNNFSLQRLCAPINLTHSVEENLLTLNWDVEGQQTTKETKSNSRFLIPDYYRVFIRSNSFNFQDTTPTQTYTRLLYMYGDYEIYVNAVYLFGGVEEILSEASNIINFNYTPNQDELNAPVIFTLNQNHPNPFNPTTKISFSLPSKSMTVLNIYNLKGQLVKTLINRDLDKGNHSVNWNGTDSNGISVGSGVYYYKLKWNNKELMRKMILLK